MPLEPAKGWRVRTTIPGPELVEEHIWLVVEDDEVTVGKMRSQITYYKEGE